MKSLSCEEFCGAYKDTFETVFSKRLPDASSFANEDWVKCTFDGGLANLSDEVFLRAAKKCLGDDSFVLTVVETIPPHQQNLIGVVSSDLALPSGPLEVLHFDTMMFDVNASWGFIFGVDDFTVFGAKAELANRFAEEMRAEIGSNAQDRG